MKKKKTYQLQQQMRMQNNTNVLLSQLGGRNSGAISHGAMGGGITSGIGGGTTGGTRRVITAVNSGTGRPVKVPTAVRVLREGNNIVQSGGASSSSATTQQMQGSPIGTGTSTNIDASSASSSSSSSSSSSNSSSSDSASSSGSASATLLLVANQNQKDSQPDGSPGSNVGSSNDGNNNQSTQSSQSQSTHNHATNQLHVNSRDTLVQQRTLGTLGNGMNGLNTNMNANVTKHMNPNMNANATFPQRQPSAGYNQRLKFAPMQRVHGGVSHHVQRVASPFTHGGVGNKIGLGKVVGSQQQVMLTTTTTLRGRSRGPPGVNQ